MMRKIIIFLMLYNTCILQATLNSDLQELKNKLTGLEQSLNLLQQEQQEPSMHILPYSDPNPTLLDAEISLIILQRSQTKQPLQRLSSSKLPQKAEKLFESWHADFDRNVEIVTIFDASRMKDLFELFFSEIWAYY